VNRRHHIPLFRKHVHVHVHVHNNDYGYALQWVMLFGATLMSVTAMMMMVCYVSPNAIPLYPMAVGY
jgi:hypothetical protein